MITITDRAKEKILEVLERDSTISESDKPRTMLRVSVIGGGCSGFQYNLGFDTQTNLLDKTYEFEGTPQTGEKKSLKVVIDQASLLYLDGCEIDYVDGIGESGFKFNNPNVKSTCGCGSSFGV